jgi:UDPglucose 6-dehydrogenase
LDLNRIRAALRYPIVIDGRNLFSPDIMQELSFIYLSVGRPDVVPKEEALKFRTAQG